MSGFGPGDILFDSGFGDLGDPDGVLGGSAYFGLDDWVHHTVYGRGRHFSWDVDPNGDVHRVHMTDHGSHEIIK